MRVFKVSNVLLIKIGITFKLCLDEWQGYGEWGGGLSGAGWY